MTLPPPRALERVRALHAQLTGSAAAAAAPPSPCCSPAAACNSGTLSAGSGSVAPLPFPEKHRRSLALLSAATPPKQEAWRSAPLLRLSAAQRAFFDTFGYLQLPGLLADRAEQTERAFEQVWEAYGGGQNGQVRVV
jgi:hypothetical protein